MVLDRNRGSRLLVTEITYLSQSEIIEKLREEILRRDDPVPLLALLDLLTEEDWEQMYWELLADVGGVSPK